MYAAAALADSNNFPRTQFSAHSVNEVDKVYRVSSAVILLLLFFSIPESQAQRAEAGQSPAMQSAISVQQLRVPSKARQYLHRAEQQFNKNHFSSAMAAVEQALQVAPDCASAFTMRALIKLASGNVSGALADASQATALDPNDALSFLALATANNFQQDFVNAQTAARQALKMQPDLWQAHLELAKALDGQGQFLPALRELSSLKTDFPDIHLVRAKLLMRLGQDHEAAQEFGLFLDEAPSDRRAGQIKSLAAGLAQTSSPAEPIQK